MLWCLEWCLDEGLHIESDNFPLFQLLRSFVPSKDESIGIPARKAVYILADVL